MIIQVNGECVELVTGDTLAALVSQLALTNLRIAVVVNDEVVPNARHSSYSLSAGDRVELLALAGGG